MNKFGSPKKILDKVYLIYSHLEVVRHKGGAGGVGYLITTDAPHWNGLRAVGSFVHDEKQHDSNRVVSGLGRDRGLFEHQGRLTD